MSNSRTGLNLMLAVGDSMIDPKTDPRMDIVPSSLGSRHVPISHAEAYDALSTAIEHCQLDVIQQKSALDKNGNRFFTIMELGNPRNGFSDLFAARWSQDKKIANSAAGGNATWICSNLCIGGTKVLNLKHTANMKNKLVAEYCNGISQVIEQNDQQAKLLESFRTTKLKQVHADSIIMEMLRQDIITSNNIKKVDLEWKNPRHAEHAEDGHSVNRLYAAVTEVAFKPQRSSAQEVLYNRGPRLMSLLKKVVDKLG